MSFFVIHFRSLLYFWEVVEWLLGLSFFFEINDKKYVENNFNDFIHLLMQSLTYVCYMSNIW